MTEKVNTASGTGDGATKRFRARILSTEVEALPISNQLAPPAKLNTAQKKIYYFYLMAPAIALLAFISLYPFFWLIVLSFQKGDMGPVEWVGFKNFINLAHDGRFLSGWGLLFKYSALCLFLQVSIGLLLAVVVNNSRYEKFLVTALLMPMMMAPAVAGLLWMFLYNGTFGWYHWIFQSLDTWHGFDPVECQDSDVRHRSGGRLAMDPSDHAYCAGWSEAGTARSTRGEYG